MNRALDLSDIDTAFTHAANMIEPLETDQLTPRNYYTLYHQVSTSLFALSTSLTDPGRIATRILAEQYEVVQYNPRCLRRLYLMIVVGQELAAREFCRTLEILEDLIDMVRQAQDPIRALFLRHFLLSTFKQTLPGSTELDLSRSLGFLLTNFSQMNRLWVRIGNIMASDDCRAQRSELSVLLGMNIQRISALSDLTGDWYAEHVLPYLAKHIELCEDDLAQEFILGSIIYTFPVEFHVQTIGQLFTIFGRVEQGVRILTILNEILDRLQGYVGTMEDGEAARAVFVTIATNIEELFNSEGHLGLTEKFETLEKLLKFEMKIAPNDVRNVRNLMKFTDFHIQMSIGEDVLPSWTASEKLRAFIELPLLSFANAADLFELDYLPILINRLLVNDRLTIAAIICNLFVSSATRIETAEQLQFFLSVAISLAKEGTGKSCFYAVFHLIDAGTLLDTLVLMQRLANSIDETTDEAAAKAIFPICFRVLRLLSFEGVTAEERAKVLQFVSVYGERAIERSPQGALLLFGEAAKFLEVIGLDDDAARFAALAFERWPELPKPAHQCRMLTYLIGFMTASRVLQLELNAQLCSFAASLQTPDPLKPVVALLNCGALFWRRDERANDVRSVQACLAKAARLANAAGANGAAALLHAFYLVLASVAFWLAKGVAIEPKWVHAIISVISEKHAEVVGAGSTVEKVVGRPVKMIYVNTGRFMQDNALVPPDEDEGEDEEDEPE
jgi:hypothetical protein